MKNIKWAPVIPLAGGFPLGAEMAIGSPPEFVASYEGFWGNDSQYMNYQNNVLGKNLDYINFTKNEDFKSKVNITVCTPPCAGLSQLNLGKTPEVKGAGCAKNEWMYQVLKDSIERLAADVVITENAPALSTNKGMPVAAELYRIAKYYGYSLSLYKTSTHFHGLPQRRDRTFALAWKSKTAPVLNWYDLERKTFKDYLLDIPESASQQDIVVNPKVVTEPYYQFIQYKLGKHDVREDIVTMTNTSFDWVNDNGLLAEANEWFKATNNEAGIKYSDHAIKKFAQGLGIWNGSVHVFEDVMNAVIGRNLSDTIHPTQDRSLTIREAIHMMGMPHDYELVGGRPKTNMLAQNVPTCTAACIVKEAMKFLNGELEMSNHDFVFQNNWNKKIDYSRSSDYNKQSVTLEELIE